MKIKIESVETDHSGSYLVTAATDIGTVRGIWCSKEMPIIGEAWYAELTLPDLKREDVEISQNAFEKVSVFVDLEGFTHFCGVCEQIEEDACCTIRFTEGWLDLIIIFPPDFSVGDYVKYSIPSNNIEIYPIDLLSE